MNQLIASLKKEIADNVSSEASSNTMLELMRQIEKKYQKLAFQYSKSEEYKTITIQLLNKTIDRLNEKQAQLEEQKHQLEYQSKVLDANLHALQMSYDELEQFAYIVSHDLKSPLRNIGSFSQLLTRRYGKQFDAEASEYLGYITSGVHKMSNIITDLLEYSQMNSHQHLEMCAFEEIIDQVVQNISETIRINKAEIVIDAMPTLRIHPLSCMQLIQNLLENAIKYQSDVAPIINISAKKINADLWQFSVRDNGVGLDEIYQEKAFLAFQRIDNRDRPGSGIGLAICKKAVRMNGGRIWYTKNKTSPGTTFHFTISQRVKSPRAAAVEELMIDN
jgi:light-regulated signal transduction histidine kinase (bacteriophytochrome)